MRSTAQRLHRWAAPAGLWALAFIAGLWVSPRGLVYWDSFSYVAQALDGRAGGLMLGRPGFVIASHLVALAVLSLGASVWALPAVLKIFWLSIGSLTAPFTLVLSRALGLSPRAALWAGALVALSPAMAHTSGALLTDVPSVALTLGAFAVMASIARPHGVETDGVNTKEIGQAREHSVLARAALAGALLGVSVTLREQAIAQALTLAWLSLRIDRRLRFRAMVLCALSLTVVAAVPPVGFALTQRGYIAQVLSWPEHMARERAQNAYRLSDFWAFVLWLPTLGPVALIAGILAWARRETWSVALRPVTVPGVLQLSFLAFYQDISYSPRYLLPALVGALVLPASVLVDRWVKGGSSPLRERLIVALTVLPIVVSGPVLRAREKPLREAVEALPRRLMALPPDAVIVTGQACPAVSMIRRLAREPGVRFGPVPPRWRLVCPGWGWPERPEQTLDRALAEGRTVVVDLRPGAWIGPRQGAVRSVAAQWIARHEHRSERVLSWQ